MNPSLHRKTFTAMGCPCEIAVYAESRHDAINALKQGIGEIQRLDHKYSHYRNDNHLAEVQRLASGPTGVEVDRETASLLNYADTQFEVSGGMFDITAAPLTALWDRRNELPEKTAIDQALALTGWKRVDWDGKRLRLKSGMRLDLGGVVKEYAADRAALALKSAGISLGFIDLGGDLNFLGPHPDGEPWQAGIRSPDRTAHAIASIEIKSGGLASSGNYERFNEIDGVRYGHIINPHSGWPLNAEFETLESVSVTAPTCLLAGSLSTLASLADEESGLEMLENSGLPWLAVRRDGSLCGMMSDEPIPAYETSASSGWTRQSPPSQP